MIFIIYQISNSEVYFSHPLIIYFLCISFMVVKQNSKWQPFKESVPSIFDLLGQIGSYFWKATCPFEWNLFCVCSFYTCPMLQQIFLNINLHFMRFFFLTVLNYSNASFETFVSFKWVMSWACKLVVRVAASSYQNKSVKSTLK